MKKGFSFIIVLLILVGTATAAFFIFKPPKPTNNNPGQLQDNTQISWEFDINSKSWKAYGDPPDCREPLVFPSPVDIKLASGILYPGQTRSGDYKPHGGFRFDALENNLVDVYAPMDANLIEAARHPTSGETQYVLYFLDDCGIIYKLDHLRELTPKFDEILNKIPMGGENDTRTTRIRPAVFTKKGEHIATKVGLESNRNVFVDFGVYDLRKTNNVNYTSHEYYNIEQYGAHAICWLDNLEETDKKIAKSLPGADGQNGKKSDYCN